MAANVNFSGALVRDNIAFKKDARLAEYSTFKIGGEAGYIVFPNSSEQFISAIRSAKKNGVRFDIVGNASNILFADEGYDGAIIVTKKISDLRINGSAEIECGCGVMLPRLAAMAAEESLSGVEFACGIPGTVGGAVFMNAGAYGNEMGDVLVCSTAYDIKKDEIVEISLAEHEFSYRHSAYMKNTDLVCIGARLKLQVGDAREIKEKMDIFNSKRRASQPIAFANAGSFFKRPEGHFAAKLIDDCGLKGYRIGDACVSDKHAGFIVNLGGATSKDVLELSEYVAERVFSETGIKLEREVRFIG